MTEPSAAAVVRAQELVIDPSFVRDDVQAIARALDARAAEVWEEAAKIALKAVCGGGFSSVRCLHDECRAARRAAADIQAHAIAAEARREGQ